MIGRRLLPLLVAPALALACAGAPPSDDDDANVSDAEIRASCTTPRRYYVAFPYPSKCDVVEGVRGRWVPEATPIFGDAPASFAESACIVRWTGERGAAPDKKALDEVVGYAGAAAPACGPAASAQHAEAKAAPGRCDLCQGGAVGCDVCGRLGKDGHLWTVLPPTDALTKPRVFVRLSDGTQRVFAIEGATGAAIVDLPPPPEGTHYVEGNVSVVAD